MSDDLHGSILSVSERVVGDSLDAAASLAATTISLNDVSDFDEAGGSLTLNGTVYAYDRIDMDGDSIHVPVGLAASAAIGDRVDVWDPDAGLSVIQRTALVLVDDQQGGDPITADIDHSLAPLLERNTYAVGQSVSMTRDGSGYTVDRVHGRQALVTQRSDSANGLQVGIDQGDGTVAGMAVTPGGTIVSLWTLSDVRVKLPGGGTSAWMPIKASAFTVSSDSSLKTDTADPPDALAIIAAAPAAHWRYLSDEPAVKRVGPMANDLPDWLVEVDDEDGTLGVDLARMSGLHHRAIEQLVARIETLEARVAQLEG